MYVVLSLSALLCLARHVLCYGFYGSQASSSRVAPLQKLRLLKTLLLAVMLTPKYLNLGLIS